VGGRARDVEALAVGGEEGAGHRLEAGEIVILHELAVPNLHVRPERRDRAELLEPPEEIACVPSRNRHGGAIGPEPRLFQEGRVDVENRDLAHEGEDRVVGAAPVGFLVAPVGENPSDELVRRHLVGQHPVERMKPPARDDRR